MRALPPSDQLQAQAGDLMVYPRVGVGEGGGFHGFVRESDRLLIHSTLPGWAGRRLRHIDSVRQHLSGHATAITGQQGRA